jgi:hypothetical protein
MRNSHLDVRLNDDRGNFMSYLVVAEALLLLARHVALVKEQRGKRILTIALIPPPPPPSDSPSSSATITANESMVNAGIGLRFQRSGGHVRLSEVSYLTRGHRDAVHDKVEGFDREHPSFGDRLVPTLRQRLQQSVAKRTADAPAPA